MRILVTGSRDWDDYTAVFRALDAVCEEFGLNYEPDEYGNTMPDSSKLTVVHGACPTGADAIADDWTVVNFMVAERHPADWQSFGKYAGPKRNKEMVDLGADICLAFPKGASRGTRGCMKLAREAGIPVKVYEFDPS